MLRLLRLLLICFAGLSCNLSLGLAAEEPPVFSKETAADVERIIRQHMAELGIPGATTAVMLNGEVVFNQGFGLSDVENNVKVMPETVFRLASVSKTITAVAAMRLAQEKKLDLDAPVQMYCPAFPRKSAPITTRMLLAHTSGIRHYREGEGEYTRHYSSLNEALSVFKDDPLVHQPGADFTYTTFGYGVLGCAVEGASGLSFPEYVKRFISTPAGLNHLQVDVQEGLIANRAQGYFRSEAEPQKLKNSQLADTSYKIPGGGLVATALDLVKFAQALLNGTLLAPATFTAMTTEQRTYSGKATEYGLGWIIQNDAGYHQIFHTGAQSRVSTVLYLLPDRKFAVSILANLEGSKLRLLASKIRDRIFGPSITLDKAPEETYWFDRIRS